jgi:hypothetical protein
VLYQLSYTRNVFGPGPGLGDLAVS